MSLGRDPATHRYRYAAATVRGTKRDAQRAAAHLVSEADLGRIPLTKETFGGLLARWLEHIDAADVLRRRWSRTAGWRRHSPISSARSLFRG